MASRNLNMRGTRDRTDEFLEKVKEEHGDIVKERKSRKNPLQVLSKEKRKLHKLEKRKRETNKETENFFDNVNDIMKKIENLKMKVEEVRKKQGIFFSAPIFIEKDMAELEQLSDVIYSECYNIQAQIKTLERDSSSIFGPHRKFCCMQNEYLLSQMKKVMDDFRLMQTGYVDKRKRQYRENWVTSTEKTPSTTAHVNSTESVKVVANGIDHSKKDKGKSKKSRNSETFTEDKQTGEPEDDYNGNSLKRDKSRFSGRFLFKRKNSKTKPKQEESLQNGTENSPSEILENGNEVDSENKTDLIYRRNSENSSVSEDKEEVDNNDGENAKKSENTDSEIEPTDTLKRDKSRFSGIFFKRKKSETNSNESENEEEEEEDIDLAFKRYSQAEDKQSLDSENANEGSTLKEKNLDYLQISEEDNKKVSNENSDLGNKDVSQISEEGDNSNETEISFKRDSGSFSKEEPQETIEFKDIESPNGKKTSKGENKIKNSDTLNEEMEPMITRNNHKSQSAESGNLILDLTPKTNSQASKHERLIETSSTNSNRVKAEKGKKKKLSVMFSFKKQKSESSFKQDGLQSSPLQEMSENLEQEEESPLIAKYNAESKSKQIITSGPEKTVDSKGVSNLRNVESSVINIEGNKSKFEAGQVIRRKSDSFTDSEKSLESSAEVSFIDESNGKGGKSKLNGIFRSKRPKSQTISELDESQQKLIDTSQNRLMEERRDDHAKVENDTSSDIQIQHSADGQMIVDIETEKSREELKAIQLREERLKKLEQNISGMTELQKELHSIVQSGGEQMDRIEDYVDTSKYNVEYGQAQLIKAEKYQKKFRKRKIIFGIVGVTVILIIVIVILIVTV
ncbi:unnamed protein product [Mytilus coruscus]|uniref:t-SNARE coiled-coil homology domain-containing protein n=1 Tax=Mytilus coruscus TaxID=42192 RepID=A0A6J8A117_MYTCO|nr:unnamed protein product [Mytilus coruscus]